MSDVMLDAFKETLDGLGISPGREHGMYAPIAKRCPVRIDDELPPKVRTKLVANHTCACTDSDVVYVDTRLAGDMFVKAKKATGDEDTIAEWDIRDNYKTLLVHEYTHIIMQHVVKCAKFLKANGDENYPIFAYACDIEANRGYGISRDCDLYKIAVTDDALPKCKGVEGLMNIYRVLKKHYGDEIKQQYDELQKEQKEGEGKSESKSEGNGEGNDESVSESESKNVMRRAMPSMEQMKEEAEQKAATMTEEELEKGIEDFDENNPHAMGGLTDSAGNIALSPSPEQALRAQYDAYLTCEVEKAVSKLKNLVKGNQVKTRVKTYSRQSRKDSPDGLIRKGTKNEKALAPRILVAMDSSGSMSSTTVTPIAKAIGSIAKSVGKTKGSYICEHDGVVGNIQPLSKWEEVVKNYYPSGDNDFDLVLEKAIELGVQVVLNIGDGYCKFFKQYTIRRAAEKGIKWIDVQVTGEYDLLKRIREADEKRYVGCIGKFIDWEIIKVGEDD